MAIWKFKAKCLSLLDEVHKTIKAILVTRFGKPVAKVIPPSAEVVSGTWIGSMKDSMKTFGISCLRRAMKMTGRLCEVETDSGHSHLVVELA